MQAMSDPIFWENKKNITSLSSAELAKRVVKDKAFRDLFSLSGVHIEKISKNEILSHNERPAEMSRDQDG